MTTGQEELNVTGGRVHSLAFSPDSRHIAVMQLHSGVSIYDVATGQKDSGFNAGFAVYRLAFNQDGSRLAVGSSIRDLSTGRELFLRESPKRGEQGVFGVAFSSDGKRLATSLAAAYLIPKGGIKPADIAANQNVAGDIKVWDTITGQKLLTLRGHTSEVFSVTFGPDGKRLASAGGRWNRGLETRSAANQEGPADVKIWDTTTGRDLFTIRGHTGAVYCVAFSPDGKLLATGGRDKILRIWKSD